MHLLYSCSKNHESVTKSNCKNQYNQIYTNLDSVREQYIDQYNLYYSLLSKYHLIVRSIASLKE